MVESKFKRYLTFFFIFNGLEKDLNGLEKDFIGLEKDLIN